MWALPFANFDIEWNARGLQLNVANVLCFEFSVITLGVGSVDGIAVGATAPRVFAFLVVGANVLRARRAGTGELASFNGWLLWINRICKPLFSCLGRVPQYIGEPIVDTIRVPNGVFPRFTLKFACWFLWSADLTKFWWFGFLAIGVVASFGFGGSVANVALSFLRGPVVSITFVHHMRFIVFQTDFHERPRSSNEISFFLRRSKFKRKWTIRANRLFHFVF